MLDRERKGGVLLNHDPSVSSFPCQNLIQLLKVYSMCSIRLKLHAMHQMSFVARGKPFAFNTNLTSRVDTRAATRLTFLALRQGTAATLLQVLAAITSLIGASARDSDLLVIDAVNVLVELASGSAPFLLETGSFFGGLVVGHVITIQHGLVKLCGHVWLRRCLLGKVIVIRVVWTDVWVDTRVVLGIIRVQILVLSLVGNRDLGTSHGCLLRFNAVSGRRISSVFALRRD
jgi:hypothetical protein